MSLATSHPYTLHLPSFEGPLDLLLRLIEKQELAITAISLAHVADQYLDHVRAIENPDPAAMADFLALAAQLLLIKTRALLPRPTPPQPATEDDPGEQLARQLREYQHFKQVAEQLRTWEHEGRRSWERLAVPPELPNSQPILQPHTVNALIGAIQRRLKLLADTDPPPLHIPRPKTITIGEVSERLHERLTQQSFCTLEDLLDLMPTRAAVIVTLWTVLELLKREIIDVEQAKLFDLISIGRGSRFGESWQMSN